MSNNVNRNASRGNFIAIKRDSFLATGGFNKNTHIQQVSSLISHEDFQHMLTLSVT